jgi:hypothetical protein
MYYHGVHELARLVLGLWCSMTPRLNSYFIIRQHCNWPMNKEGFSSIDLQGYWFDVLAHVTNRV